MKAYIAGKPLLSTTDWPGTVCCVVFFVGCNMRCRYCFNSPILEFDDRFLCDLEDVYTELEEQRFLIDGVIATGGEPTLQPEALRALAKWTKSHQLRFGLMTNGTRPAILRDLLSERMLDYVAVDIKTVPKPQDYTHITQTKKDILPLLQETVKLLKGAEIHYEFRTTLVPQLNSSPDQILRIADWVGHDHYVLQAFRPSETVLDPKLRHRSFTPQELASLRQFANRHNIATRF